MLQLAGRGLVNGAQDVTRGWGYVSARVTRLRQGDSLVLPHQTKRFVLVSGSLRMDSADAPTRTIYALADPIDTALPTGTQWVLHALSDSVFVLYSER